MLLLIEDCHPNRQMRWLHIRPRNARVLCLIQITQIKCTFLMWKDIKIHISITETNTLCKIPQKSKYSSVSGKYCKQLRNTFLNIFIPGSRYGMLQNLGNGIDKTLFLRTNYKYFIMKRSIRHECSLRAQIILHNNMKVSDFIGCCKPDCNERKRRLVE